MKRDHWTTYKCVRCGVAFLSSVDCKGHFETSHHATRLVAELDAPVNLSREPLDIHQAFQCPLCHDNLKSVEEYGFHVGRHQEHLSLFALPSVEADRKSDTGAGNIGTESARNCGADEKHLNESMEDETPAVIANLTKSDSQGGAVDNVSEKEADESRMLYFYGFAHTNWWRCTTVS